MIGLTAFNDSNKMKHNKKINSDVELLRFVFAFIIMSYHYGAGIGFTGLASMVNGMLGVEFFFVLSGIFAARSANRYLKQKNNENVDIGVSTRLFIMRKIKAFYPYVLIAIAIIIAIFFWDHGFDENIFTYIFNQIPDYLLLLEGGFYVSGPLVLEASWYLSSMIIGLLILYPLCIWKKNLCIYVIFPLIFIFTIGYMASTLGSITWPIHWLGVVNAGLLRGIGEMALGFIIYDLIERLDNIEFNNLGNVLLTIIKLLAFILVIQYCLGYYPSIRTTSFLFLIGFFLMLVCSSAGFHLPYNNKICMFLGSISLPLYLLHGAVRDIAIRVCGSAWIADNCLQVMVFAVLLSIISVLFVNLLKNGEYMKKITTLFVKT